MTASSDYERAFTSILKENGVTDYHFEHRRKHRVLRFRWNRCRMHYFYPSSPPDRRGVKNAEADLRRIMGVERKINKNPDRRRKTKSSPPVECPRITSKPDPFAVLRGAS